MAMFYYLMRSRLSRHRQGFDELRSSEVRHRAFFVHHRPEWSYEILNATIDCTLMFLFHNRNSNLNKFSEFCQESAVLVLLLDTWIRNYSCSNFQLLTDNHLIRTCSRLFWIGTRQTEQQWSAFPEYRSTRQGFLCRHFNVKWNPRAWSLA